MFWAALVVGWGVIPVGVRGLLVNADPPMATDPPGWALLLLQSNVAHDFVLVPFVLVVSSFVARVVPAPIRAPIQAGLICSGVVVLFAFPFVQRYGANGGNPSILPQDYGRGLLTVLTAVWIVTAALVVWSWRRSKPGAMSPDDVGL